MCASLLFSVFVLSSYFCLSLLVFFFNATATTEIYTLSLHDALPIYPGPRRPSQRGSGRARFGGTAKSRRTGRARASAPRRDRKSTRLNSSHSQISYAVFCLKKKKKKKNNTY